MIFTLKIREEAAEEIVVAYEWYEDKRLGLGEDFLGELEKVYTLISKKPEFFQKKYKSFRSARLERFPFAVFYEIDGKLVVVYSMFHSSREPLSWKRE